jgi:ribonuclease-3
MSRTRQLLDELGIEIDPQLYSLALTHRSYAYENGGLPHNERLEFLGDAVLGVVVTEYLYRSYPDFPEGRLAKLRAAVVNAQSLASVARDLQLGDELLLGRGEVTTGGSDKASILADSLEALFGAVLISCGRDERDLGSPVYRIAETGPDHDKRFTAVAVVGEQSFAPGKGRSKKQAEQQAAEAAFLALATD